MKRILVLCLLALAWAGPTADAMACTAFHLRAGDGGVVVGRSMEFSIDLQSELMAVPRGLTFTSGAPGGKPGLVWKNKFGFVGISALGISRVVDGVNEKGLSAGALWLPHSIYQNVPESQAARAINIIDLVHWILGSFENVEEVRRAMPSVVVWGEMLAKLNTVPPLHIIVHDETGKCIVIEFNNGEQGVFDNPLGVLTNAPGLEWHLINLRNYVNISPWNIKPVNIGGFFLVPTGQGSGLLGLPGDSTPPSRFVRAAFFAHTAAQAGNPGEGLILAQHILNTVDIPRGTVRENPEGQALLETTQWNCIKDLKNKVLYYRTYDNMSIRAIELNQLNLKEGQGVKKAALDTGIAIQDVSGNLK